MGSDLAAERGGLELVVDDRHRHHRPELAHARHRLGPGQQPAAQGAGDGGQHHVVHGAAVRATDPAVDREVGPDADETTLLRQHAGHRGVADGPPVRERRADARQPPGGGLRLPQHRGRVAADRADDDARGARATRSPRRPPGRPASAADAGATRRARAAWAPATRRAAPGPGRRSRRRPPGSGGTWTSTATRPPSSPSTRYISHSGRLRSSGRDTMRATSSRSWSWRAGARERGPADVVGEVEARCVHPHRVGEVAGHPPEPLPVARHEGDPVTDQPHQGGVVEARVAGLEDLHGRVVHRGRRRLVGQEGQVARPQPVAHRHPLPSLVSARLGFFQSPRRATGSCEGEGNPCVTS